MRIPASPATARRWRLGRLQALTGDGMNADYEIKGNRGAVKPP
jgi:hypothetical protein